MSLNSLNSRDHAASVLEDEYRKLFPDGARYWEGSKLEIDCVRFAPRDLEKLIFCEIKLQNLSLKEKGAIALELKRKFNTSKLSNRYALDQVEVLGGIDVLRCLVSKGK